MLAIAYIGRALDIYAVDINRTAPRSQRIGKPNILTCNHETS
jgi:hypothetical protein